MQNIETLIIDLKDSLERRVGGFRGEVQQVQEGIAQLNARFDAQAEKLERGADRLEAELGKLGRHSA